MGTNFWQTARVGSISGVELRPSYWRIASAGTADRGIFFNDNICTWSIGHTLCD